ncbi:MAG TPA: hypothetical protein VFB07_04565 [Vicinamibacterales bacterium]|nr:hypothetical protein [Vicinamibacterales bacterium]
MSFSAGGAAVITDGNTKFKGMSCDDLSKGHRTVAGSGTTDGSGAIRADVVQKVDDKGRGDNQ